MDVDGNDTAPPTDGADGSKDAKQPKAEPVYRTEKKKRTRKSDVPVQSQGLEVPLAELNGLCEAEGQMAAADRLAEETIEMKNELEAYILSLRNKLYSEYEAYVKEDERSSISSKLEKAEDWLYDDGEDETKSAYTNKLQELKALGDPIAVRAFEDKARPAAISQLHESCKGYMDIVMSNNPAYAHLTQEERAQVHQTCNDALQWLQKANGQQKALSPVDPPALHCAEV